VVHGAAGVHAFSAAKQTASLRAQSADVLELRLELRSAYEKLRLSREEAAAESLHGRDALARMAVESPQVLELRLELRNVKEILRLSREEVDQLSQTLRGRDAECRQLEQTVAELRRGLAATANSPCASVHFATELRQGGASIGKDCWGWRGGKRGGCPIKR